MIIVYRLITKKYIGIKYGVDVFCDADTYCYSGKGMINQNSSEQSELVGGIDFAKIQEYGDEADPRT